MDLLVLMKLCIPLDHHHLSQHFKKAPELGDSFFSYLTSAFSQKKYFWKFIQQLPCLKILLPVFSVCRWEQFSWDAWNGFVGMIKRQKNVKMLFMNWKASFKNLTCTTSIEQRPRSKERSWENLWLRPRDPPDHRGCHLKIDSGGC